jgi:DNA-binding response OmpR family regulator
MVAALRASGSLADVPVLLLTARADDELRIVLLHEGAQDYLTKPFQPRELLARRQPGERQARPRPAVRGACRRLGRP